MRKKLYIFAVLIVISTVGVSTRADDRKEINTLYKKLAVAMKKKDVKTVMSLATPDFSMKMPNGQVQKAEAIEASMKQMFSATKSIDKLETKIDSLKIQGNKAVAVSTTAFACTMQDAQGQMHKYTENSTSRDYLVKTKKGWRFQRTEALKARVTVDGKPFDPYGISQPPQSQK
ncbi:MAG TPA: nuclear transport factor 2 family protein [Chthonomonadales bacterium]|nr:nuclear transport factor 2 family protein [Chthonomonadales bacterium]